MIDRMHKSRSRSEGAARIRGNAPGAPDAGSDEASAQPPSGPADRLRFSMIYPKLIVIGTSTGGPQALASMLEDLSPHLDNVPVVVVLHIPPAFTNVVANQIERATGRSTSAARNGERPRAGCIYLAPGDKHLKIVKIGDTMNLCHFDAPPENFCRPSVDVLFRTAAQAYGAGVLGIVLTGMGVDGLNGARAIVEKGGSVIVQDEKSSVVWGMPGAIARQGLAAAVLPPSEIAQTVAGLLRGQPPGKRS